MDYIDIHTHMISRTTEDYQRLALTGCVAVSEPAFWGGFPRRSAAAFAAYFEQLTAFEPTRAAKFGLQHYSWVGLDPREALLALRPHLGEGGPRVDPDAERRSGTETLAVQDQRFACDEPTGGPARRAELQVRAAGAR